LPKGTGERRSRLSGQIHHAQALLWGVPGQQAGRLRGGGSQPGTRLDGLGYAAGQAAGLTFVLLALAVTITAGILAAIRIRTARAAW
jgi:hypothetical protein